MWMEVFNHEVSKSNGIEFVCNHLKLSDYTVFAVGNDYNDIDMLEYANNSFAVSNSPDELKAKFRVTKSNNNSGFSEAVKVLGIQ